MKRAASILGLVAVIVVAGGLLVQVLGRAPSSGAQTPVVASPAPTEEAPVSNTPAAAPPVATECKDPILHLTTFDRASDTVSDMADASKAVFQGTITAIEPAEWNTPDGRQPAGTQATDVRRMATVKVDAVGKGVKAGSTVTVALPGGQIGCDIYHLQGVPDIAVGDSAVLFVQTFGDVEPPGLGVGMATVQLPIGSDGKVQTPEDGSLSPAALLAKVPTP